MILPDPATLGTMLKAKARSMSRAKYQRPTVRKWTGKSGKSFWRAEWRVYVTGRPKPKHRVETWPCERHTKAAAQAACDRFVREETGTEHADGSMTLAEFWERVFWPVREANVSRNTATAYRGYWRNHIAPTLGGLELQRITKNTVDQRLVAMAASGAAENLIDGVLSLLSSMLIEALENDYIAKNPCRKVQIPRNAKPKDATRSLTGAEVARLIQATQGKDRLFWRLLIFTGLRIGELFGLRKDDLMDGVIRVDEQAQRGKMSPTKSRKTRYAPVPAQLWADLQAWAAQQPGDLLFPGRSGKIQWGNSQGVEAVLERGRTLAGIPDLTARMCRTTFATLYEGDVADMQAILGHHSAEFSIEHYKRAIADRQRAAADEMEARLAGKVVEIRRKA